MYGLVTFVTTLGPSGQWLPTSSPTSRFIVASSSSGTQPTVLVCWATPDRLPCRRRRCRPRGRSASMMLAISRARRRPEPRAERARLLRASLPHPVDITSLLASTTPRHRATARDRADLPRRRRRCRSRCRRASPMLALSRARRRLTPRAARAYRLRAAATSVASPRYSSSP